MQSTKQDNQTVLYTIESFSTRGYGKELERVKVTRGEYRELKKHLATLRAAKRAA